MHALQSDALTVGLPAVVQDHAVAPHGHAEPLGRSSPLLSRCPRPGLALEPRWRLVVPGRIADEDILAVQPSPGAKPSRQQPTASEPPAITSGRLATSGQEKPLSLAYTVRGEMVRRKIRLPASLRQPNRRSGTPCLTTRALTAAGLRHPAVVDPLARCQARGA